MKREDGFTLPELLVALAVSIGLVIATLIVARPADFSSADLQAERRLNLALLMQALQRYKEAEGHLPEGIPTKSTGLASDGYDICKVLVPTYIKDIPIDPVDGLKTVNTLAETDDPCNADGVQYYSAYTIKLNKNGTLTLADETPVGRSIALTH